MTTQSADAGPRFLRAGCDNPIHLRRVIEQLCDKGKTIMIRFHLIVQTLLVTVMAASSVHAVDFERDIQPVLNTHCAGCHGGVKKSGGFSVMVVICCWRRPIPGSRQSCRGMPMAVS